MLTVRSTENFGPTGLLDAWHGTNEKVRRSRTGRAELAQFLAALADAEKMCNGDRAAAERKVLSDLAAAGY